MRRSGNGGFYISHSVGLLAALTKDGSDASGQLEQSADRGDSSVRIPS